ncbi:hypothetical protein [Brevundimonas sp.]|uniref:hypothetical protein n=1 Tax=Brevundimonas sp. TaxID=1871086 RepID=UPI002AB8F311|nr:hypothetical protein [Brevundimonas sp.]MDZ4363953.1 hypothetical protein [Brevundimonas sp.]
MKFPAIGFTPDREIWGFPTLDSLVTCGRKTLKDNMQAGMELIDGRGRRWVVSGVRRVGRAKPFIPWLFWAVLSGPQYRIEHDLETLADVSLDDVKTRACQSLAAFPTDYGAEDENDPELVSLMNKVRKAKTVAAIVKLLGLDSFEGH